MAKQKPRDPPGKERPPATDEAAQPWRLFIAVPLPPPAMRLIGELIATLGANDWPVRWIAADTAHLTLQFLGDTPPERAELLRLALAPVVAAHAAFALQTDGLGVFPNPRRPRVLWLGLQGETEHLAALQRDVNALLRRLAFPFDARPFNPHITLGRLRDGADRERDLPAAIERGLTAAAGRLDLAAPRPVPVREVLLVRSFLSRQGARHEPIGRYPLAAEGGQA